MQPSELDALLEAELQDTAVADVSPGAARMERFDNRRRALFAQVALALNPMLYIGVFAFAVVNEIIAVNSGVAPFDFDSFAVTADVAELVIRFVTAVAFIAWLHRASKNTYILARESPEHGSGMAIGGWFIPCGSFWIPYQVVSEIDRKSDPDNLGSSSPIVATWWAAWIVTLLLLNAVKRAEGDFATLVGLALIASQLAAATLAILVIRRIESNQLALAARTDAHTIAAQFE